MSASFSCPYYDIQLQNRRLSNEKVNDISLLAIFDSEFKVTYNCNLYYDENDFKSFGDLLVDYQKFASLGKSKLQKLVIAL